MSLPGPVVKSWGVVVCVLVVGLCTRASAKQCVEVNACTCIYDDGSGTVDLTSNGNKDGTARYKDYTAFDSYLYSYNPCKGFTDGGCTDIAMCQSDYGKTLFYNLGTQDTATWSFDGTNIQLYYYAETDTLRETFVTVKCDPTMTTPFVAVQGEQPIGSPQYYLELTSSCACPDGCAVTIPPTATVTLQGGSILLIVFFVCAFLYLVGGMVVKKTRYQAQGREIFPNTSFWGAIPGLIKEGCTFTIGLVTRRRSKYDQV